MTSAKSKKNSKKAAKFNVMLRFWISPGTSNNIIIIIIIVVVVIIFIIIIIVVVVVIIIIITVEPDYVAGLWVCQKASR